jgi:hypothetical protein
MYIPIPIPTGVKHVACVRGSVLKVISCQHCHQRFAYRVELEAEGHVIDLSYLDGQRSAEQALQKAQDNLLRKRDNAVLPVPCPNCGMYQDDMARSLKADASVNWQQIVGGVVFAVSFLPVLLAVRDPMAWGVIVVGAGVGLALVVRGYTTSFGFDPNAGDPDPRRADGRRLTIWGEELAQLLEEVPSG